MNYILDTNILMDYPEILSNQENKYIIHSKVREELDSLKECGDKRKEKKAIKAFISISNNISNIILDDTIIFEKTVDDTLIKLAKKKNYTLLTNDINIQLNCKIKKVPFKNYYKVDNSEETIRKLKIGIDDEAICQIYSNKYFNKNLVENQYFSIYEDEECKDIFVYKNKEFKKVIISTPIKSTYSKQMIRPRNVEQTCLMNVLQDKNISIVYAGGPFGSGKSFLLTNYAIEQLEKGNINKIVFVPNNSDTEDSRSIGALPGTLFEKELAYMGTLVDIIGEQMVTSLFLSNQLEIMPINMARGRNLENSIILVNEAENLTEKQIKLLIGRCAEGTRIFFDGDIKQADGKIFREKSGLRLLEKLQESQEFAPIFGMVKLRKVERSKTARAADYLDKL